MLSFITKILLNDIEYCNVIIKTKINNEMQIICQMCGFSTENINSFYTWLLLKGVYYFLPTKCVRTCELCWSDVILLTEKVVVRGTGFILPEVEFIKYHTVLQGPSRMT